MMKYYIYCRYEYASKNGIEFTRWFRSNFSSEDKEAAEIELKRCKTSIKQIDKITKRKHEYEIRYVDETLIPQIILHRPVGRPKKISNETLDVLIKELNKKGKVEVPEDIKGYIYNDEVIHNYISSKIKKDKWARYWYNDDNVLYILLKNNDESILD